MRVESTRVVPGQTNQSAPTPSGTAHPVDETERGETFVRSRGGEKPGLCVLRRRRRYDLTGKPGQDAGLAEAVGPRRGHGAEEGDRYRAD